MAVNSFCIVESFQIFKNQLVCLLIIANFKAIEPFAFDNRMKGFNACIIPRKSFLRITALHIVKHCGLHALRHSFGSYLLASGIDIKVVSILMGHKDVSTTYNYYIHISNQQLIEATTIFDHL